MMLSCKIKEGTSALVTSVSNQAIDNLCEVLAHTCPDVRFCVLGKPKNFRLKGHDSLFLHSLEVQTAIELCPAMAGLPYDQLLEFILSVGVGDAKRPEEDSFNLRAPVRQPQHMRKPWVLLQEAIETFRRECQSRLEAELDELLLLRSQDDDASPEQQRGAKEDALRRSIKECIDGTGEMRAQALLDRLIPEAEAAVIDRCTTFVCTVGSIERAKDRKLASKRIQTAIVDESSLLPEFAVPRLLTKWAPLEPATPWIQNLVLLGDHKQLASFSYGPFSTDNGSLMQRIAEVSGCHLLQEQYRMDPAICQLVSELFYGGRLYTNAAVAIERRKSRRDGMAAPVVLYDIAGEERHPPGVKSMSWENEKEALAIVQWYKQLRDKGSRNTRIRNRSRKVLIICLYAAQAKLLQQLLPADTDNHNFAQYGAYKDKLLKIVTVDSAQGSEDDIVVLSCVRANFNGSIGHANNMKRACVALSRARRELHIFADVRTMASKRNRLWCENENENDPLLFLFSFLFLLRSDQFAKTGSGQTDGRSTEKGAGFTGRKHLTW